MPRPTRWPVAEDEELDPPSAPGARLEATIGAALDRLSPEGRLGVAVSGGGDSMALLAIAARWASGRGRELRAVTVDHGLRPGSAGEAAFVSGQCARLGVPHQTLRAGPMPPGNLPAAAREARYGLMADWARGNRVSGVLVGHTMDDQAETLLMRLARGSGVEGLSGMSPRRDWQGVSWIRPMLTLRRAALRDWLQAQGIAWIDDPTNDDPAYDRVKARRALLALEPLGITVEGLAGTARVLARQRRVLARAASDAEAAAVRWGDFGEVRLALTSLRATEADTAMRVLAQTLVRVAGRGPRPRARSLEPALSALLAGTGGAVTLGGCLLVPDLDGAHLLICREPAAVAARAPLEPPGTVWDGRWRISIGQEWPDNLHVGALGQGGNEHLRRLAREGFWRPREAWSTAPRPVRETVPAIFDAGKGDAPLAVPSAGFVAAGAPPALSAVAVSHTRPRPAAA